MQPNTVASCGQLENLAITTPAPEPWSICILALPAFATGGVIAAGSGFNVSGACRLCLLHNPLVLLRYRIISHKPCIL